MPPGGGGGGGGGQQEGDNSLGPMWIMIGVFVACAFIWHYFYAQIIGFVITLRSYETTLISFFIPYGWSNKLILLQNQLHAMQQSNFSTINFDELVDISSKVGQFLKYPVVLMLTGFAVVVFVAHATFRFKKTHSMDNLIEQEKDNWPQILPIAKLDLIHEDISKGPWAMAMQPMDFAKTNKLIIEEKQTPDPTKLSSKAVYSATINRDEARKIFAMQLGHYWTSAEALPPHIKALFAAFAARINGDKDSAAKILTQISRSTPSGKLDFSGVNEMLNKHKESKLVTTIVKRHAFVLTVMASMLEITREDGVLACADFLWLKPVDRRLWYMLNCVGRQTAFAEVSGPFAHWLVEKELNRRLNIPMVEEAVNALEAAMKELIYKPDEES